MRYLLAAAAIACASPAAAEGDYCAEYAAKFSILFRTLTGHGLNPYYQDRVYWHCANPDEAPPSLDAALPAPVKKPATDNPVVVVAEPLDTWAARCAARFKSFDAKSGTIKPYNRRARVPCPVAR